MKLKTVAHVSCTCSHDFQDATYGKGVRVANRVNKPVPVPPDGSARVRCTVCKKEHIVSEGRMH